MSTYLIYAPLIGWKDSPVCLRGIQAPTASKALAVARAEFGPGVIYSTGRRFDGDKLTAIEQVKVY